MHIVSRRFDSSRSWGSCNRAFIEQRGDELLRRFEADWVARSATAQKKEDGELKHWEESLEIEAGKTFAGIGFMYALKNLRDRLDRGENVQLRAVAFTLSRKFRPSRALSSKRPISICGSTARRLRRFFARRYRFPSQAIRSSASTCLPAPPRPKRACLIKLLDAHTRLINKDEPADGQTIDMHSRRYDDGLRTQLESVK